METGGIRTGNLAELNPYGKKALESRPGVKEFFADGLVGVAECTRNDMRSMAFRLVNSRGQVATFDTSFLQRMSAVPAGASLPESIARNLMQGLEPRWVGANSLPGFHQTAELTPHGRDALLSPSDRGDAQAVRAFFQSPAVVTHVQYPSHFGFGGTQSGPLATLTNLDGQKREIDLHWLQSVAVQGPAAETLAWERAPGA